MAFYVGQKVVCVEANPNPGMVWGADVPVEGAVYTVAGFSRSPYDNSETICLVEIKNSPRVGSGYHHRRFRPVTERKTSIEVFKAMLNPSKQEVEA